MSWNNAGPITDVEPRQSVVWNYSWNNGQDKGLQLAGPHYPTSVVSPGNLPTLVASNQGIQLDGFGQGGGVMVNYVVTITNVSAFESGRHNLQGGGVS